MSLTPNNSLAFRNGISRLAERFVYLETLRVLTTGIAGYPDILPLDVVSSESFTRYELLALLASLSGIQVFMWWLPQSC
jgi:hypothetical protein